MEFGSARLVERTQHLQAMNNFHTYRAELHVHTVLSPCAGVEMIPPLIIRQAERLRIDLIAITDHNASANGAAVIAAAQESTVHVLPGMELQTLEEVHILCLFDSLVACNAFQVEVDQRLPDMRNNPEYFGEQFIVDDTGEFIRREERLLLSSANLPLEEAVQLVHAHGGLAIPAHIDRRAYGLIANLGLIPTNSEFDALEISSQIAFSQAAELIPGANRFPLIQSGDVHYLADFLGANLLTLAEPTIAEIRLAFKQEDGRALNHLPAPEQATR
jgi:PHP family Zn ribbon phosphoesterase